MPERKGSKMPKPEEIAPPKKPKKKRVAKFAMAGGTAQKEDLKEEPITDEEMKQQPEEEMPPKGPPPAIELPPPSFFKKEVTPDPSAFSDEEPTDHYTAIAATPLPAPNKKPQSPSLWRSWRGTLLAGTATILGIFGVKMYEEKKQHEDIEPTHSSAIEEKTSPPPSRNEPINQSKEHLTTIHTLKPGESLWGIAEEMLSNAHLEDIDGTLSLEIVKALREKNDIKGDPTKSRKMWVGEKIDLSSAFAVIAEEKNEKNSTVHAQQKENSRPSHEKFLKSSVHADNAIDTQTASLISPELTSPTLAAPGETIWSRTYNILTSLDVKPNLAKRSVLTAIVLADSHKSETEAMRVKHQNHPKFDPAKDTLDFTRTAQAAVDLKNGMSPTDVAKKYGVANVYERIRHR